MAQNLRIQLRRLVFYPLNYGDLTTARPPKLAVWRLAKVEACDPATSEGGNYGDVLNICNTIKIAYQSQRGK